MTNSRRKRTTRAVATYCDPGLVYVQLTRVLKRPPQSRIAILGRCGMWILGCKSVLHEYHTALTFKRVLLRELIVIPCPLKEESSAVVVNKAR